MTGRGVPEAAMVAGALARLQLIADENDGPWKGAATTAFEVVERSHTEAVSILDGLAALGAVVIENMRACPACMAVQIRRRGEMTETHNPGCLIVRARRWLGQED